MASSVKQLLVVAMIYVCGGVTLAADINDMESDEYNTSVSNLTIDISASMQCLQRISLINFPISLLCICLSMIACLATFIIYILIRDKVLFVTNPQGGIDSTKHWIHFNFVISFIIRDLAYMTVVSLYIDQGTTWSYELPLRRLREAFHVYATNCYFFWVFVEGLWVFLGVHFVYEYQNFRYMKVKTCLIGWATPAVLTFIWTMSETFRQHRDEENGFWEPPSVVCILAPIYLILFLNLLMMIKVLYHLNYILRNDVDGHSAWLKLAKATLILSLLLGLNFIIPVAITRPLEKMPCAQQIVGFVNLISSSLQGLFFAYYFVLTKKEIRESFKSVKKNVRNSLPYISVTPRGSSSQRTMSTTASNSPRTSRVSQSSMMNTRGSMGSNTPSPRMSRSSQAQRLSQSSLTAPRGSTGSYNGNPHSPRNSHSGKVARLSQSALMNARGSTGSGNGTPPSPRRSRSSQPSRLSQTFLPTNGNPGSYNGNFLYPPSTHWSRKSDSALTAGFQPPKIHDFHSPGITLTINFEPPEPNETSEESRPLQPAPAHEESTESHQLLQPDKKPAQDINSNEVTEPLTSNI